jgi:hypothetical protein
MFLNHVIDCLYHKYNLPIPTYLEYIWGNIAPDPNVISYTRNAANPIIPATATGARKATAALVNSGADGLGLYDPVPVGTAPVAVTAGIVGPIGYGMSLLVTPIVRVSVIVVTSSLSSYVLVPDVGYGTPTDVVVWNSAIVEASGGNA